MYEDNPGLSLLQGPYLSHLDFNCGYAAVSNSQSSASHLWGITKKRKAFLPSVPHLFVRAGPEAVLPSMPSSSPPHLNHVGRNKPVNLIRLAEGV